MLSIDSSPPLLQGRDVFVNHVNKNRGLWRTSLESLRLETTSADEAIHLIKDSFAYSLASDQEKREINNHFLKKINKNDSLNSFKKALKKIESSFNQILTASEKSAKPRSPQLQNLNPSKPIDSRRYRMSVWSPWARRPLHTLNEAELITLIKAYKTGYFFDTLSPNMKRRNPKSLRLVFLGPSGCGKTSFANDLLRTLGQSNFFPHDRVTERNGTSSPFVVDQVTRSVTSSIDFTIVDGFNFEHKNFNESVAKLKRLFMGLINFEKSKSAYEEATQEIRESFMNLLGVPYERLSAVDNPRADILVFTLPSTAEVAEVKMLRAFMHQFKFLGIPIGVLVSKMNLCSVDERTIYAPAPAAQPPAYHPAAPAPAANNRRENTFSLEAPPAVLLYPTLLPFPDDPSLPRIHTLPIRPIAYGKGVQAVDSSDTPTPAQRVQVLRTFVHYILAAELGLGVDVTATSINSEVEKMQAIWKVTGRKLALSPVRSETADLTSSEIEESSDSIEELALMEYRPEDLKPVTRPETPVANRAETPREVTGRVKPLCETNPRLFLAASNVLMSIIHQQIRK